MAIFIEVDKGEVVSYVSAKVGPAGFIEATDPQKKQLRAAYDAMAATAQPGRPTYAADGTIGVPVDARPVLSMVPDKTEFAADGVDSCTVTVSLLRANGTVNTGFNGSRIFRLVSGDYWRLNFVAGVATKTLRTTVSQRIEQRSVEEFRLVEPLSVIAYY